MEKSPDRRAEVEHLRKTDQDTPVRWLAQALLLVEEGQSQASAARLVHMSAYRVHI